MSDQDGTALTLYDVTKSYGPVQAVSGVSLRVNTGEVLAFLGPSGCGKSTTLGIVAGFIRPDTGTVHCGSRNLTHMAPEQRDIGMVFQSAALFPHMSVSRNISFGLRRRKVPAGEIRSRVAKVVEMMRLQGLDDRLPSELSGGQGQRVSLARALVINPSLLLLDEPMSSLDADLRRELRRDLADLHRKTGTTTVLVTHDKQEALALADRVAVMKDGVIQALDSPQKILEEPPTAFTARFVAEANLFTGTVVEARDGKLVVEINGAKMPALAASDLNPGAEILLAVRPQALLLTKPSSTAIVSGPRGRILGVQHLLNTTEVRIECGTTIAVAEVPGRSLDYQIGASVIVHWRGADARGFPGE